MIVFIDARTILFLESVIVGLCLQSMKKNSMLPASSPLLYIVRTVLKAE